jgi:hypothetical protein
MSRLTTLFSVTVGIWTGRSTRKMVAVRTVNLNVSRMSFSTTSSADDDRGAPDLNQGHEGFDIVRLRVSNIVKAVIDGKPFLKLLYVYCDELLPPKLGKVRPI